MAPKSIMIYFFFYFLQSKRTKSTFQSDDVIVTMVAMVAMVTIKDVADKCTVEVTLMTSSMQGSGWLLWKPNALSKVRAVCGKMHCGRYA